MSSLTNDEQNNIIGYDTYAKEIVNPTFGPTKLISVTTGIMHYYYYHYNYYY